MPREAPNAGPGVAGSPPVDFCIEELDDGSMCGVPLPQPHHPMRRYCDEHSPAEMKKRAAKRRDKAPDDMSRPPKVEVNLKMPGATKTGKGASDAKLVKEGAERMLGLLSLGFIVAGDEVCGMALQKQAPLIAVQIGELATYHPGLKKLFAPMESTGEGMAWIGLAIAVAPVIIAILVHHNLVKPELADKLAVIAQVGSSMTGGPSGAD